MFILLKKAAQNALRMPHTASFSTPTYEEALTQLYALQSNADYLKRARDIRNNNIGKLELVEKYFLRCGISPNKIDKLSIIHVAGTKGKGSTCAFLELILRKHGYRTGFFSSPHLVSVRERIRINGLPITEEEFVHHFFRIHELLQKGKEHELDVPGFFPFLTILMVSVFLSVRVDVAIIEVGIGGEYDSTNVIKHPVCTGITSLGLDHTFLLGNSLSDIAYHKSGIFKPGATAFTVPQPEEAMTVLKQRAVAKNCELYIVPPLDSYKWQNGPPDLGIQSNVQHYNASLAIELAIEWMKADNQKHTNQFRLEKVVDALSSCKWPGRTQILRSKSIDFFLDGAHTVESIEHCKAWFKRVTEESKGDQILVFNTSGQRNSIQLLSHLKDINFRKAYFVPNHSGASKISWNTNAELIEEQIVKCKQHSEFWGNGSAVANSVLEAFDDIKRNYEFNDVSGFENKPQVLVTGSLHLVGAVFEVLDPHLTMKTDY